MIDAVTLERLHLIRNKVLSKTASIEELREGVSLMRQNRMSAASASKGAVGTKRAAVAKANINSDDLLSELEGL